MWTTNIWVWLLLYPSIARKALETFDCIALRGTYYLRVDPAIICYDDEWNNMAALATLGIIVTCVIAPVVLVLQTSRKHASVERVARARVALLTNTYKDGFHYWEAVRCYAACVARQTGPRRN